MPRTARVTRASAVKVINARLVTGASLHFAFVGGSRAIPTARGWPCFTLMVEVVLLSTICLLLKMGQLWRLAALFLLSLIGNAYITLTHAR
jgi:hypothetical protein